MQPDDVSTFKKQNIKEKILSKKNIKEKNLMNSSSLNI
jgi:hypothetical protein